MTTSDARKRNAERTPTPSGSTFNDWLATAYGWTDPPTWHYLDADDFTQERTMSKTDRHDELVALLTEIRDCLPEPKREEAFVERHPAVVGYNLRHWKPGVHTAGVDCSCGPEKVLHESGQASSDPAPADDLPGEPVEPGDLRAGDKVAFTWEGTGERIIGALVSDHGGDVLRSEGFVPSVVVNGGWRYGISDVRLVERAPREDEALARVLCDMGWTDVPTMTDWIDVARAAREHIEAEHGGALHAVADAARRNHAAFEEARARAEQAEAERDALRDKAADLRERLRVTELDGSRRIVSLRERLDALRADIRRDRATFTPSTATAILARDNERAAKGERR